MKNPSVIFAIIVSVILCVSIYLNIRNREDSGKSEKIYNEKIAALKDSIKIIHQKYIVIDSELEKSKFKIDSINIKVDQLNLSIVKLRKKKDEKINDYKKLHAIDAWAVFVKYLNNRPE